MKKAIFIALILTFCCSMLEGQKLKFGVTGGGNITFLRLTNSSEISNDENLKPFLGFSAGLVIKLKISEPWQLSLNSDFIKTSSKGSLLFVNNYGTPQGTSNYNINNHYLSFSSIVSYEIIPKFQLGSGLFFNYLLWSKTFIHAKGDMHGGGSWRATNRFINHYFNDFLLGVPIEVKYIIERFDVYLRVNIGLTNRIKGNDAFVYEYENTLTIGASYFFGSR